MANGRTTSESKEDIKKFVINLQVNRYAFKVALWFIYTDQIYPYIKGVWTVVTILDIHLVLIEDFVGLYYHSYDNIIWLDSSVSRY